ncbi:MCP four helix bundle domain-containing protein, partial [bacterium]|nr:MCP four helix bundle domain-containing protein [bacterium]
MKFNSTIKNKLLFLIFLIVMVAMLVLFFTVQQLSNMNAHLKYIVEGSANRVRLGHLINHDLLYISREEKNIILSRSEYDMAKFSLRITSKSSSMNKRVLQFREVLNSHDQNKLNKFSRIWEKYLESNQKVINFALLNSNTKARDLSSKQGVRAFQKAESSMNVLGELNEEEANIIDNLRKESERKAKLLATLTKKVHLLKGMELDFGLVKTKLDKLTLLKKMLAQKESVNECIKLLKPIIGEDLREFNQKLKLSFSKYINTKEGDRNSYKNPKNNSEKAEHIENLSLREMQFLVDQMIKINIKDQLKSKKLRLNFMNSALIVANIIQDMLVIHRAEMSFILETTQVGLDVYADILHEKTYA